MCKSDLLYGQNKILTNVNLSADLIACYFCYEVIGWMN